MNTTQDFSQNIITLLDGIITWPPEYPIQIRGISSDSRETKKGDLFIAHAGPKTERTHFIEQAIENGAVAVLKEAEENTTAFEVLTQKNSTIPICAIPQLNTHVASIAARFYQNPCQDLKFIGITGTSGKTSCTQFIARILGENNIRCGTVGTLGEGFPDNITPNTLTTPGAIDLQRILAKLKQQGATHIAMEVSSHSLVQNRVDKIPFEIAVFTNLSRDHLDYHGDMAHYAAAKRLLFLTPTLKHAVINADDAFGRELIEEFAPRLNCYAYTSENIILDKVPTVQATDLQFHTQGFSANISSPWGKGKLHTKLLGRFNLNNLLATLTTLCLLDLPFQTVLEKLATLSTVPGRMECFGGGKYPLVVVDYSHKPDALEKALIALREHTTQELWCVFGCGGNRDKGKRPLMAQIAESCSDHVIVTDDNPRFEDPHAIVEDIMQGFSNRENIKIEHDRKRAIAYAIEHAKAGDIVLVAGKGHETYQQIGDQKIPFSDAEEVQYELS